MNQTPLPHGSAPGGAPQNAPFGAGFFAWIRGLGIGRGGDRWFAGVAGGIAMRAGIDPIIVRGIFVVLAVLGGPGIVLYLAGWLLLPDQGGKIHLEEVFRGRAGTAAVVATVAVGVFVVLPVFFRILGFTTIGGWNLWNAFGLPHWLVTTISVLVWIGVIAVAGFLISRLFLERGRRVRDESQAQSPNGQQSFGEGASWSAAPGQSWATPPTTGGAADAQATHAFASPPSAASTDAPFAGAAPQQDQPPTTQLPQPAPDWTQRIADSAERASEKATKWSEDVGRQADEWSARYAAQHDLMKLGAAHVVITLAIALLAAGGAAYIAFDMQLNQNLVLTAALLGATGVLAVSLIVAGIRGRHTGWVGFLAACGVIALLFTSIIPDGSRFQPFGTALVTADDPGSVLIAGTTDVDLTTLDDVNGASDMEVWQLAGRSVITLPEDEPVLLTIRLLAGSLDASELSTGSSSAAGPFLSRTIDTRVDRDDDAARVTVYLLAGSVRVEEAPASNESLKRAADSATANRADLREELTDLREEESTLRSELDEPGLSEVRQERLENTLDFTRDEIAKLEKELAR
ncbi:PspC domain-containing protein [Leucobacter aridicollis]|uniref:PspC domain-containing protein n=1 Tax=Leucobacter aridicollis TaxID=283878 RepID=UPI002107B227|nr:PspC domain-containing protein [Leucobacter aridicollis]UTX52679.1 PspC domain-containing protein [Leucobacter aridicollis]